jgi:capsular exopolysaccharide synthesis family protein
MEQIKKAVDLAYQERKLKPVYAFPNKRKPVAEVVDVTYSQTKVVSMSPEVLEKNRIIMEDNNSQEVAAYRMLRTQVLQRMVAKGWNALAITSAGAGQGKTLTAINLAISLAREVHRTVLLADFDLRRPRLHQYLGFEPQSGIGDYILRDTPLHEIVINPGIERLVVLPGKEPLLNSSEMLASPKMVQLVEELKTRYPSRLVIFDLPPLLAADDALAFSPYVDAFLMVLEEGKTNKDDLQQAMGMLQGTNLIGTVLNKSRDAISANY